MLLAGNSKFSTCLKFAYLYSLHDIEAVSFIPYLVNKVGDPKDQVRIGIRTMFKRLRQVYPVSKLCPFIIEGISSKNAKQRTGKYVNFKENFY